MTKRMLIDASHPEETRVVVLDGNRLEEFDLEAATKRPLKGNIYLAKVVRVEPSLQAAFVEYGGNRHGFLAFSEIHPDYYQIPVADRQRLLEMQAAEAREEEEAEGGDATPESPMDRAEEWGGDEADAWRRRAETAPEAVEPETLNAEAPAAEDETLPPAEPAPAEEAAEAAEPPVAEDAEPPPAEAAPEPPEAAATDVAETETETVPEPAPAAEPTAAEAAQPAPESAEPAPSHTAGLGDQPEIAYPWPNGHAGNGQAEPIEHGNGEAAVEAEADLPPDAEEAPPPETIGGEGAEEVTRERRIPPKFLRHYKIQEVIKRRQIMLVQVVKEERGTKGAALTTYISLAGRFSVLMPNSPRGGGVSRKITSAADRKRLREIIDELGLPDGMSLIIRTAGAQRPKPEIKRDCEYLLRLWDNIRERTLQSTAPALIYEEADLIKRSIRDVFSRDVEEVLVDGEGAYREAREFMRMLMPQQTRKIQLYRDGGLFARYQVEQQLDAIHSPTVQLRSGGYLVINQTEALVAIDVNSGRSTRERHIEDTALRTNLEAADEIARQLRLRDLAGLIVIDFIDMESNKHDAMVERRLKEALKQDRARIQVGRISHFGLLEMSRQRLRPSLAETTFVTCPHCQGRGQVRSVESAALAVLRAIEEEGAKRRAAEIAVHVAAPVALYLLNRKRDRLAQIEARFGMAVMFEPDDTLLPPAVRIERVRAAEPSQRPAEAAPAALRMDYAPEPEPAEEEAEEEAPAEAEAQAPARPNGDASAEGEQHRRKRRRRRRRGARTEAGAPQEAATEGEDDADGEEEAEATLAGQVEESATLAEGEEAETGEEAMGEARAEEDGASGQRRRRRRRGRGAAVP
ncbi:MAG: Rne/Rng family ribonuclease, partial [Acetobacteraceae bacterium]|nr:Rne/Rng family ribonuclease [Acetobacteraceae bacterium]